MVYRSPGSRRFHASRQLFGRLPPESIPAHTSLLAPCSAGLVALRAASEPRAPLDVARARRAFRSRDFGPSQSPRRLLGQTSLASIAAYAGAPAPYPEASVAPQF